MSDVNMYCVTSIIISSTQNILQRRNNVISANFPVHWDSNIFALNSLLGSEFVNDIFVLE